MKDNSIGRWNPAWGPKPEKVKERKPPATSKNHNRWRRVTCWSCPEKPTFSIWGPPSEKYICQGCGLPMSVSTVANNSEAARLPGQRRRRRSSDG